MLLIQSQSPQDKYHSLKREVMLPKKKKKNQSYEVIEHEEKFTPSRIHSSQEFPSVMLFTIKMAKAS